MTDEEKKELKRAHDDYVEASMYAGDSYDDGNPHRQMEYDSARSARIKFYNLCAKYGIDPSKYHE